MTFDRNTMGANVDRGPTRFHSLGSCLMYVHTCKDCDARAYVVCVCVKCMHVQIVYQYVLVNNICTHTLGVHGGAARGGARAMD